MKVARDLSIDILRGWAIIFMMAGHVIFFRYGLTSWPLNTILLFANSFCYITFLFTFGVGLYYSIILPKWNTERQWKMMRRLITLLIMYYIAGIISLWSYYPLSTWNVGLLLSEVKRVILFTYYPSFTEYLPSFALLSALGFGLRSFAKDKLSLWFSRPWVWLTLSFGLALHFIANWIAGGIETVPTGLRLLIGSQQTFDFPILQYLPIVLCGLSVGAWTKEAKLQVDMKILTTAYTLLLSTLALKYSFTITHALGWTLPFLNTPLRWPPSFLFLLEGLSYAFLFWVGSRWMLSWRWTRSINSILLYIGNRAMGFLLYHLLLLFIMKIMGIPLFNVWQLILFYASIPLSYYLFEKIWQNYASYAQLRISENDSGMRGAHRIR